MHSIRTVDRGDTAQVGWGLQVLLLSSEGQDGLIARRLAGLGCHVNVVEEMFAALAEVIDDPAGHALFVVDCATAGVGGLEAARQAVMLAGGATSRVPVILVSQDCETQSFPLDRQQPTILRAPLSAVSLKVGFEHALHDRLVYQAA